MFATMELYVGYRLLLLLLLFTYIIIYYLD